MWTTRGSERRWRSGRGYGRSDGPARAQFINKDWDQAARAAHRVPNELELEGVMHITKRRLAFFTGKPYLSNFYQITIYYCWGISATYTMLNFVLDRQWATPDMEPFINPPWAQHPIIPIIH